MHLMYALDAHAYTKQESPHPYRKLSTIAVKLGNGALQIRDRIIFDFHPGLDTTL